MHNFPKLMDSRGEVCGVGGWMAHVILVSALGPNPSFFLFWGLLFNLGACWDRGPDLDLDQGLTIGCNLLSPD